MSKGYTESSADVYAQSNMYPAAYPPGSEITHGYTPILRNPPQLTSLYRNTMCIQYRNKRRKRTIRHSQVCDRN